MPNEKPTTEQISEKYETLKDVLMEGKPGIAYYRRPFLKECYEYAEQFRVQEPPPVKNYDNWDELGNWVLENLGNLKPARDSIVDWVLFEPQFSPNSESFKDALIETLEQLLEIKTIKYTSSHYKEWFEAQNVFVYETFLYIVAALIKNKEFETLNLIFNHKYMPNLTERTEQKFDNFSHFYTLSKTLQILRSEEMKKEGSTLRSPTGKAIKRQADRTDLPFPEIIQAELLIYMMALIKGKFWFPETYIYGSREYFPFFIRATHACNFDSIAKISGIDNPDKLNKTIEDAIQNKQYDDFPSTTENLRYSMQIGKLGKE